jgi:hypothetical protein
MNYGKLLIGLVAMLMLAAIALKIYDAGGDAREAKIVAKYTKLIDKQKAEALAKESKDRLELNERSAHYEQALADLRNADPVPIIRVRNTCPKPMPEAATVAGEPSKTSTDRLHSEDGQPSPEVQLSNGLRSYATECQAIALQLNEVIQAWPR